MSRAGPTYSRSNLPYSRWTPITDRRWTTDDEQRRTTTVNYGFVGAIDEPTAGATLWLRIGTERWSRMVLFTLIYGKYQSPLIIYDNPRLTAWSHGRQVGPSVTRIIVGSGGR